MTEKLRHQAILRRDYPELHQRQKEAARREIAQALVDRLFAGDRKSHFIQLEEIYDVDPEDFRGLDILYRIDIMIAQVFASGIFATHEYTIAELLKMLWRRIVGRKKSQ